MNVLKFEDGGEYSYMLCPICRQACVHLDYVHISARPEGEGDCRGEGEYKEIVIDAVTGRVAEDVSVPGPGRVSRRHGIAIMGWCETCGEEMALIFAQQKGQTLFKVTKAPYDVGGYNNNPLR